MEKIFNIYLVSVKITTDKEITVTLQSIPNFKNKHNE